MLRKIMYSAIIKNVLRLFFSIFYDSKYLRGNYFDKKRMGWYWCFIGIKSRLWGTNRHIPWPVNPNTIISNPNRIHFDIDNINIFQTPGCYWQNLDADIFIGKDCWVGPNVGIITTNHDVYDPSKHSKGKNVILGDSCWVGMNSVILPGVELGRNTVVGAGSVVTKSFPDGNCVIGGVPAKQIKRL